MNLESLLDLARDAAWAGAAILERHNRHVTGQRVAFSGKGPAGDPSGLSASPIDLITDIDKESEKAVLAILRRSGIAIVAEESGGEAADAVWYVDPLDGTTNYAHGHPFCAVSIGLVVDGEPKLGVVHAPMLGALWSGIADQPGTRKDLFRGLTHPLQVSEVPSLDRVLGATGFPYDRRTSKDNNFSAFSEVTKQTHGVLRCGSAALDLALVADGTYDGYWERKLAPWDIAAGAALVLSAGGRVTDPWGSSLVVTAGGIVATNGHVHDALLSAIAPHQPKKP
jgi:myo-inositol-1(or 4)-monophosphatase